MHSIIIVLISAILSESLIHGYVYQLFGDTQVPQPGATIFINNTIFGDMTDDNGEYSFEVEPGEYTVEFFMMGMLPIERDIEIINNDTLEVSFKITPGNLHPGALIYIYAMGGGAYILDDNGYPLSNLRVSLPSYGLSDTTDRFGNFYLEPFDAVTNLYIHLYDGSIDSSYTLSPYYSQGRIITLSESGKCKVCENDSTYY